MLRYRLITGPLLIVLLIVLVAVDDWLDRVRLSGFFSELFLGREHAPSGIILLIPALIAVPIAALELGRILHAANFRTSRWLSVFASALMLLLGFGIAVIWSDGTAASSTVIAALLPTGLATVFILALLEFSRGRQTAGVTGGVAGAMVVMVYPALFLSFYFLIRQSHSAWWILGIVMTAKMCDTGAYFTGRAIGRHKLIPWLSPGKTREGLVGGIIAAMIAGAVFAAASEWLPSPEDHVPWWFGAICGLVFAIVGQAGDLAMSLFKRDAKIKDSSSILPGLGGMMDVLDSPTMVAPFAYWLVLLA